MIKFNLKNKISFFKRLKQNKGFALLFVIVISSIILSVALGLADVSYKEILFSTSNRVSNDAFYAADTGVECALYWDLGSSTSFFGVDPQVSGVTTRCTNIIIDIFTTIPGMPNSWIFYLYGLGSSGNACVKVEVTKNISPTNQTKIVASGYNIGDAPTCTSTNTNRVERQLEVTY
ncbi:MAG: hypothetical protein M3P22_00195 [bacterium]|nr:hypothetical protein [bacterium]